ncbi:DUF3169 family protein [uncultured Planococcus sp.]|uniref:DUF3169 family protein n=1 Tax=uncultured Planococcus sp. TaxID=337815 RepID=UPI00261DAA68|nr:DUF3169 family protein [uncultured Planococcus sp.]
MKKFGRISGQLLIGSLIGFFGMLAVLDGDIRIDLSPYAYAGNIIILAIAAALVVFSAYCYFSVRILAKQDLTGDEKDAAEGRMYKKYSDASLSSTLAILLSLASMSLSILTIQPLWLLLLGLVLIIFSFTISIILPGLMKNMYPERNLPTISDKKYAEKLLNVSDDGEKHVMLGGLYKTHITMNSLLLGAIVLLLFYSMASESSQLFSIFIIIGILAITNMQYQFSIRNK